MLGIEIEMLDPTPWISGFVRGYGLTVKQTTG